MTNTHPDAKAETAFVADEPDSPAENETQVRAANDSTSERKQYEVLLRQVFEQCDATYAFVLTPAGQGDYDEQFVKLAAVAERGEEGGVRFCYDSLAKNRPDPMILSVMRLRRGVCGRPTDIGLPACLPGAHPTIRYFVMLPIEAGASRTSILFVANPSDIRNLHSDGGLMERLDVLIKKHIRQQLLEAVPEIAPAANRDDGSGARHYVQLMTAAINAVVITDINGTITAFNPAAENLFGCSSSRALGAPFDRYISQKFLMPILRRASTFDSPTSVGEILPVRHQPLTAVVESGNTVHLTCSAYHTRIADNVYTTFVVDHESQSIEVHDAHSGHQQFQALTNVAPVGIVQLGSDWTCTYANQMWCQLSGLTMDETIGEGWVDAIHAEDVVDALVELRESLSNNEIFSRDIRLQRPAGQVSWVTLSATLTTSTTGQLSGCLLVLLDITDAHLASEELRYAATHDVLTGLANRARFLDELQSRIDNIDTREQTSLLYLDLDGFKAINDTLGHDCGDELLREVSARLLSNVPSEDLCARLGGDEFTIIVSSVTNYDDICNLAERIIRSFKQPFQIFDNELTLSTSIGIAISDATILSNDELIKQADIAVYKAKSSGRSRWVVYTQDFKHEDSQRSVLQASVRRAAENQEFTIVYQPQYRIEDESISGFEALLRWQRTDMDVPDTQTTINILEENGLINEVGQWVLESACHQFRSWLDAGLLSDQCTMSVNVAPAQLSLTNFTARVQAILERSDMPAERLILEITESALIEENSSCVHVLDAVKELGVCVSLDDFGTGYASLSYLTRLPIDCLKIDRSFIGAMITDEPSRMIVMSVLALAATLNIDVVAEGIEDQATLDLLRKNNCKYAQGYLLCMPGTVASLEPALVRNSVCMMDIVELC